MVAQENPRRRDRVRFVYRRACGRVSYHGVDGVGEAPFESGGVGRVVRHEEAGDGVADHLGDAADGRGHHRGSDTPSPQD